MTSYFSISKLNILPIRFKIMCGKSSDFSVTKGQDKSSKLPHAIFYSLKNKINSQHLKVTVKNRHKVQECLSISDGIQPQEHCPLDHPNIWSIYQYLAVPFSLKQRTSHRLWKTHLSQGRMLKCNDLWSNLWYACPPIGHQGIQSFLGHYAASIVCLGFVLSKEYRF